MNKAFIFDMDGVVIDSETGWVGVDKDFLGERINRAIGDQILGSTLTVIYDLACQHGLVMPKEDFYRRYNELAKSVYEQAQLTAGIDHCIDVLQTAGFRLGLVSSSPKAWIDWVLQRLAKPEAFEYVLSIEDNPELSSKPAPDGYLRAIEALGATPDTTIILEDSNNGAASAKASGAFTIGFREHLLPTYDLKNVDKYVHNLAELEEYLQGRPL